MHAYTCKSRAINHVKCFNARTATEGSVTKQKDFFAPRTPDVLHEHELH